MSAPFGTLSAGGRSHADFSGALDRVPYGVFHVLFGVIFLTTAAGHLVRPSARPSADVLDGAVGQISLARWQQ